MKPRNRWAIFVVVLYCFANANCKNVRNHGGESFLDAGSANLERQRNEYGEQGDNENTDNTFDNLNILRGKAQCYDNDNCKNGAKCENKFCKCLPGTSGDFCDIVTECQTGELKECKDDIGTCLYSKEDKQAYCKCTDESKIFDKEKNVCKRDFCVEKCGVASKEKDGDVLCDLHSHFVVYVECICKDENKVFDEDLKECRAKCARNTNCKNGAECKDGFCRCLPGTTGDTCDIISECVTGELKVCKGDKGTCLYSTEEKKAYCKCSDESQQFYEALHHCAGDKCLTKCGADYDVRNIECDLESTGDAKCTCIEKGKEFDEAMKECKDKCVTKCGPEYDTRNIRCDLESTGDATCTCKEKGKEFHEIYKECIDDKCVTKCGADYDTRNIGCDPKSTGDAKCTCKEKGKEFDEIKKECIAKCIKNDDCENGAECKDGFCRCLPGTIGNTCDIVTECVTGELKVCKGDNGTCLYSTEEQKAYCKCSDESQQFYEVLHHCAVDNCLKKCGKNYKDNKVECVGKSYQEKVTCFCIENGKIFDSKEQACKGECIADDDCDNGGKCKNRYCNCLPGTTGETCDTITECDSGKYKECKDDKGKCVYLMEKQTAYCECSDENQRFYEKKHHCEVNCITSDDCSDGKQCNEDHFCTCKKGYDGDGCKEIIACKDLEETCQKAGAKCVLDKFSGPTCECNQRNYVYDRMKNDCVAEFCKNNSCRGKSTCEFDTEKDIGYCKCTEEGKYYNYETNQCTAPTINKCLLRKEPCEDNEECKEGKCVCRVNYENYGYGCKPICKTTTCFTAANCSYVDGSCFCDEGRFYNGKECKDAKCILEDFKTKCTFCPIGFRFKDYDSRECVPKSGEICTKDCGFGLCLKGKEDERCKCFPTVARLNYDGVCILDAAKVCPNGIRLTEDSKKCNCTGRYKEAKDGITCELITCADEIARDTCAAQRATCAMQWKGLNAGFTCKCPEGYVLDPQKNVCTDKCGLDKSKAGCLRSGQVCYNSILDKGDSTPECRCPPPLKYKDGKCSQIGENVYLIHNIPILKKRYEMNGKINDVLLNSDIMESLKQTYGRNTFDYGYLINYKVEEDLLNCVVWAQFKRTPGEELKRIEFQTNKFNFPGACDGCYEDMMIWPPNILMHSPDLWKIQYEEVRTLCSQIVKDILCGREAACNGNKCYCPMGFKTVDYTIQSFQEFLILRCEDIDECAYDSRACPKNTVCINTVGDYMCQCKDGFKKVKGSRSINDKGACSDLCTPSPCQRGTCALMNNTFDCKCEPGFAGALCDRTDDSFDKAKNLTIIVGAALGTVLGVLIIVLIILCRKVKRNSVTEDFTPEQIDNHATEMTERQHKGGVSNKIYEL